MWASIAAMTGDCQYPETSLVFDEQQDHHHHPSSYRKEIAHMARYYRLHLGSFLAIELAKELAHRITITFTYFLKSTLFRS